MEELPYNGSDGPSAYRAIWISAIIQALIDGLSARNEPRLAKAKAEAIEWLSQPNHDSDFATVCELANVEPEVVKDLFNAVLEGRSKPVNFRWCRRVESMLTRTIKGKTKQPTTRGEQHD